MLTKEQILFFLKENKDHIQREYSITEVGLFGSFAIEENKEDSDIDLLVSFTEGSLQVYEKKAAFRHFFKKNFKREVDICSKKYIKPYYKNQILNTIIYV